MPLVSILRPLVPFLCLALLPAFSAAQQAADEPLPLAGVEMTPEDRAELDRILLLALPQQKSQAKALIAARPNTRLAAVLQRLIDEYETFDRIAQAEAAARAARSAWVSAAWRDCCRPLPPWNPPVGRIANTTDEPILYEIRLTGLDRTLWMGPYRLRAGASYASPSPYHVRYFTSGRVQEVCILPGDAYVFQGAPDAGDLTLAPGVAEGEPVPPMPEASSPTMPAPRLAP